MMLRRWCWRWTLSALLDILYSIFKLLLKNKLNGIDINTVAFAINRVINAYKIAETCCEDIYVRDKSWIYAKGTRNLQIQDLHFLWLISIIVLPRSIFFPSKICYESKYEYDHVFAGSRFHWSKIHHVSIFINVFMIKIRLITCVHTLGLMKYIQFHKTKVKIQ